MKIILGFNIGFHIFAKVSPNTYGTICVTAKIIVESTGDVMSYTFTYQVKYLLIGLRVCELVKENLVKRIHGGASLEEASLSKIPFFIRESEQSGAKSMIAKKAINLICDNNVIFLDASTSCYSLIPFLASKRNITVITNGVKTLIKLAEYGINTISTGGSLLNNSLALVGEEAYKTIETYNADIALFSCRGLSDDGYLTDISPEENNARKKMIQHSKKSYLLCASEKIGKSYFHNLCHKDDITGIIHE